MTDERTANEIERDIEQDRAQMSEALNDLQKKFSIDGMLNDVRGIFSNQSGDVGRAITQTVANNPGAVVLTSVGLAWLLIGQARMTSKVANPPERDANNWSQNPSYSNDRDGEDMSWLHGNGSTQSGGSGVVGKIKDTAANAINSVTGTVSDGASRAAQSAKDLSDRFLHGTEGFSDEAKARVQSARQAAYDAKAVGEAAIKSGTKSLTGFFDEQPLVLGALAMAFGAALGSALPSTQMEKDALGKTAQSLLADAQKIFAEEKAKAMSVVEAVTNEVKGTFGDAKSELAAMVPEGKTAVGAVVDRLSDAANRVMDTAKEEAKTQGLGQVTPQSEGENQ